MAHNRASEAAMNPNHATQIENRGKWMALIAALLGWTFDGFEIGLFPLVGPKALDQLLQTEIALDATVKDDWFGVIMAVFLVGAATGGVVFGWLGDRIGRVRAMSLSIFTYAIFTGLCGFANEAWQIAALRFVASLGMGGEWALGVALVTELWPDRSRALLAGLIGAAANVGFLLVALLSLVLVSFTQGTGDLLLSMGVSEERTASLVAGDGWRLLMMAGSLPALLIFFIRLFVPESHKWEAERDKGGTSHWATKDLIGVLIGAAGAMAVIFVWSPMLDNLLQPMPDGDTRTNVLRGIVTGAGLAVALLGYIYPVGRYLGRAEAAGQLPPASRSKYIGRMLLGACLSGVALLGTWGSLQWAPKWAIDLNKQAPVEAQIAYAKEYTQICSAVGAIFGTITAALLGGWLGRRVTYFGLCLASFAALVYLYQANDTFGAKLLWSVFVAGGISAAFYGWFPLYLPELFPTSIRATSQGFAYNFGRVLSAIGTLQTATLISHFAASIEPGKAGVDPAAKAGATLAAIYLVGLFIIWLGPETKGKPLPK
jgi:MFS family permease